MSNNLAADIGSATIKAAPPTGITLGMVLGAIDPQWIVAIPTAVFVIA
jgi:hypothetical protein